ncbi:AgmX/PglI C-terminal domain-containing protein [Rheinheimera baltica]|uniref:AgmX/PglI C-terminal domain-containing protein n=1 Tax=Rheinheimera baltica TaxID=67576 RepID=UPI00273E7892|nr:AgmX/PglI C-terminal domain-containing protein [Rheinheimera baltica]MDP5151628.1 AgmX/PglI C-terminal domain-containing protein [Rheinheimera baltica]
MTTLTMVAQHNGQFEDKRFYRLLWVGFALWLIFAVVVPMFEVPELSRQVQERIPEQLARVMLEERKAPPPPEPEPVPEQIIEPAKPEPMPEPEPVAAVAEPVKPDPKQAREQAQQAGLMAMRDDLADLRQSFQLNNSQPKVKSRGEQQATQVERKLLRNDAAKTFASAEAAAVSGDVARSTLADTGTTALAEAELQGLSLTGLAEPIARTDTAKAGPQGRSEAEIRRVLEANKSSLYTLYSRALRSNPLLKGKVVFELVIRADGSLAEVNIVRSELNDAKLERQLTLRLRSVDFGAEAVALTRSEWTVEFLPG